MQHGRLFRLSVCAAAVSVLAAGCARLPPGQNARSGRRLIVNLSFRRPINPLYHYYFLINNAGDQNAPGPVPVLQPPYGNGFATGSSTAPGGFTDFVVFDSLQPAGYGLYHVIGDPNRSSFVQNGRPVSYIAPDISDPRTADQLHFELDLAQLVTDANGSPLADQAQAAAAAAAIRYLQVNIVATDVVPRDAQTQVAKEVDSLGDNRTSVAVSSFLVVDTAQNRVYSNSDPGLSGSAILEPADSDVYGSANPDPSLDLVDWSVEVRQQ